MILIALGANLPSQHGGPEDTLRKALQALDARGLRVVARSSIWRSAPVPVSDQPWFCNAAVAVETTLGAGQVLRGLHDIEADFGRVRSVKNAPRVLDLDLIAYNDLVLDEGGFEVPHPRMQARTFVLRPLAEIAPTWRHPVLGMNVSEMLERLPSGQEIEKSQELEA